MDTLTDSAFAYYARHGASLFPCASGSKRPIVPWKDESTADTTAWQRWKAEGHNLAIDCAKSNLIVIDVDASKVTREEAWTAYHNLCLTWGLSTPALPTTQSARGGWHVPFKRPGNLAATDLRGGGTLIKVSDIRPDTPKEKDGEVIGFKNRGYCVAPGSHLDTSAGPLFYLLMPTADAPPIAPSVLIESLRLPIIEASYTGEKGASDKADVAKLVAELDMYGEFSVEPDWFRYMGAIKLALGDTPEGIEVALQMTQDDASDQAFWSRWKRLDSVDKGGNRCRIGSMIHRYKDLTGKNFTVRKSTESMFSEVAKLAAASGATLSSGGPLPMLGRGDKQAELWAPLLAHVPRAERTEHHPEMPDTGHPLRGAINDVIPTLAANPTAYTAALAVIEAVHPQTAAAIGVVSSKVKAQAEALRQDVEHSLRVPNDYVRDSKGFIEKDNPDNLRFLLASLDLEIRYNDWLETVELIGWKWPIWTRLGDDIIAILMTRAAQTGTRFTPSVDFIWRTLLAFAHENKQDPACDRLDSLQSNWDGKSRIDTWLSRACGVPTDAYHQAVSRSILLGLVSRIRKPGIKFDLMPVFVSEAHGTAKSTLARMLSIENEWFIENVALGESSKELVLLLAGKSVAEISEMRSRGEIDAIKAMVSATHDEGRPAFGRATVKRARRNIFIGTTNRREFLDDPTGGRRFLPINVEGEIDIEFVRQNLSQLIGEAATLEASGVDINIPREVRESASEHQEAARNVSSIEEACYDWFEREGSLFISKGDITNALRMGGFGARNHGVSTFMRKLGYVSSRANNRDRTRIWIKHTNNNISECIQLVPSQQTLMGRVEMRPRPGII